MKNLLTTVSLTQIMQKRKRRNLHLERNNKNKFGFKRADWVAVRRIPHVIPQTFSCASHAYSNNYLGQKFQPELIVNKL